MLTHSREKRAIINGMKALFIGGTGTISTAITKRLPSEGWDLTLLNRGNRNAIVPEGVHTVALDVHDEKALADYMKDKQFDVVCDFIGFVPSDVERDYRVFKGHTKQYMYISSAATYQKPCADYHITEGTCQENRYWQYARDKIECEKFLMAKYREEGFPVTIIRPSHTYDERFVPMGVHGKNGSYQVLKRMKEGKPVIIHGDGTSLWTMTHNSDFAKGFIGLMGNIHAIGEAVQITSDETVTWNQVFQAVADALGVKLNAYYVSSQFIAETGAAFDAGPGLLGDKANSVVFDCSKLKRLVPDFCCTTRFDQGVRKTVEYVMSHKECQNEDPEFDAWCDKVIAAMEKAKKEVLA